MSKKAKDAGENMVKKLPEEQEFFMRITNPNLFRRSLLETSKDVLIILKRTYNVQQIREAKQDVMGHVSQEINEIKTLIKKLYEMIPQYSKEELKKVMPEGLKKRPEPAKAEKPQLQPQQQLKAPVSDYDKLTKALDDITRKLQTL
jgi:cell shape-determining protein MreC